LEGSLHRGRLPNDYRQTDPILSLSTLEGLRSFVVRCNPEDTTLTRFEHSVRAWARGSAYVNLTAE
jgi:hypothetical protein